MAAYAGFVGIEDRSLVYVLPDDVLHGRNIGCFDIESANLAATFDKRDDYALMAVPRAILRCALLL